MKILSLFDGISCGRVALERAGINVEEYYASEIDKYAIQISEKNFPSIKHIGNVTEINATTPEPFDLLIGGSPCQDLSIAGKRKGLSGERSGLFYEYVRILKENEPQYFILENVASMSKEAKETITKELFGIEPVMINASLVSAQNRKRLFWVGKLDEFGTYKKVNIEQPQDKGILLKDVLESDVDKKYNVSEKHTNAMIATRKSKKLNIRSENEKCGTITASYYKIPNDGNYIPVRVGQFNSGGQGDRIYSPDGKSVALSALGGGRGAKTGLYSVKAITMAGTFGNRKIAKSDKAYCLAANPSSDQQPRIELNETVIRKLTPIECERLQGLSDNYTEGISNTQRYKCLGNAFNVDVVAHILKHLSTTK